MGRASRHKKQRGHPRYWHGGYAGLGIGELILPPSRHPAAAAVYEDGRRRNAWGYAALPDIVFATSSRDMSLSYARNVLEPGVTTGWVYRVMPLSTPVEDPVGHDHAVRRPRGRGARGQWPMDLVLLHQLRDGRAILMIAYETGYILR